MTVDLVRGDLAGVDAWLLVLETYGVNVWCAAGKGTFSHRRARPAHLQRPPRRGGRPRAHHPPAARRSRRRRADRPGTHRLPRRVGADPLGGPASLPRRRAEGDAADARGHVHVRRAHGARARRVPRRLSVLVGDPGAHGTRGDRRVDRCSRVRTASSARWRSSRACSPTCLGAFAGGRHPSRRAAVASLQGLLGQERCGWRARSRCGTRGAPGDARHAEPLGLGGCHPGSLGVRELRGRELHRLHSVYFTERRRTRAASRHPAASGRARAGARVLDDRLGDRIGG